MDLKKTEELYGKFVADHADFVEKWTKENLQPHQKDALVILGAGLGASAGIFCVTMEQQLNVKATTLRQAIINKLDAEMERGNQ